LALERHSTWTSLLIGCGDKGDGAVLAGTATKRRLFPEKFMPEWKVGGGLWKAVKTSLKITVTVNHFKHDLSSFHLNDPCIVSKSVIDTDNVSFCFVFLHKFCWKHFSYRQIFGDFRVANRSRKKYWCPCELSVIASDCNQNSIGQQMLNSTLSVVTIFIGCYDSW
jgi:hypothetical protein